MANGSNVKPKTIMLNHNELQYQHDKKEYTALINTLSGSLSNNSNSITSCNGSNLHQSHDPKNNPK